MKILLGLFLVLSLGMGLGWYWDHRDLQEVITRQSHAIQDQNLCLQAVEDAMLNLPTDDYALDPNKPFPPLWSEIENNPKYSQLPPNLKAKAVGKWIKENFSAYHDVCEYLLGENTKCKQLLREGVNQAHGILSYISSLESENKLLKSELDKNRESNQEALSNINKKIDQNKSDIEVMAWQAQQNTLQANTDAILSKSNSSFETYPKYSDPILDQELTHDPYHNYTIITLDKISQATVIDHD